MVKKPTSFEAENNPEMLSSALLSYVVRGTGMERRPAVIQWPACLLPWLVGADSARCAWAGWGNVGHPEKILLRELIPSSL